MLKTEVRLRTELEQEKTANNDLNKYLESKTKACEEEKHILATRNQELQMELEAVKAKVQAQNLQFVGSSSQRQQDRLCAIDIARDWKVSLNDFQFVRRLGKGAFGQWSSPKGSYLEDPKKSMVSRLYKKKA